MDQTVQVRRSIFTPNSTGGGLWFPGDATQTCYTLEPSTTPLPGKPRAMPEITCELVMQWSTEFKMDTPHMITRDDGGNILDVAGGHTYVEIHPGNFENATKDDSLDCLLVGSTRDVDYVGNSRTTFIDLVLPKLATLFARGRVYLQYMHEVGIGA
jgi:hypothetical protein